MHRLPLLLDPVQQNHMPLDIALIDFDILCYGIHVGCRSIGQLLLEGVEFPFESLEACKLVVLKLDPPL
jgi:hypothetical protein